MLCSITDAHGKAHLKGNIRVNNIFLSPELSADSGIFRCNVNQCEHHCVCIMKLVRKLRVIAHIKNMKEE